MPTLPTCVVAKYCPVGLIVNDVGGDLKANQSTHLLVGTSQTRIVLSIDDVYKLRPSPLKQRSVIDAVCL